MSIETLKYAIEEKNRKKIEQGMSRYRKANNWASDINDCDKEMYHSIVDWDKKPLASVYLMQRFEKGRKEESERIQWLLELGFEVVEGQLGFEVKDRSGRVIVTGKIDGKIKWEGKKYPFEVKSMHPNKFDRVETMEDLLAVDWTAKYVRQLQIYLYANAIDQGFFLITDCLGHFKIIIVEFDYKMMEEILQKCERVTEAVKNLTPPNFIDDYSKCRKCWAFGNACHPPVTFGSGVEVIEDPELLDDLKRREELKSAQKEYDSIDKKVKEQLKFHEHVIIGDFECKITKSQVTYKPREAKTIEVTKVKIENVRSEASVKDYE